MSIHINNFPEARLELKVGMPVMLLRNIDVKHGLTNGTRLRVIRMNDHSIECRVTSLTKSHRGTTTVLPRVPRCDFVSDDSDFPVQFKRRQIPVVPSFCATIDKNQGQTPEVGGLLLRTEVFSHGQLYTGVSRVGSFDSLRIYAKGESGTETVQLKNVVFKKLHKSFVSSRVYD